MNTLHLLRSRLPAALAGVFLLGIASCSPKVNMGAGYDSHHGPYYGASVVYSSDDYGYGRYRGDYKRYKKDKKYWKKQHKKHKKHHRRHHHDD